MKKITIYLKGEPIAIFKEVNALLVQKDKTLEILNDDTWITFTKENYDWFDVL